MYIHIYACNKQKRGHEFERAIGYMGGMEGGKGRGKWYISK